MANIYIKYNNRINLCNIKIINKDEIINIIEELNQNNISNKLIRICTDLLKDDVLDVFEFSIDFNNIINNSNSRVELGYLKRILSSIKLATIDTDNIEINLDSKKKSIINRLIKQEKNSTIFVPKEFEEYINNELEILNQIKFNNVPKDVKTKVKSRLYDKFPKIGDIESIK